MSRVIICYDMDMYFAAVAIRDNPALKNKPIVIGALPHERGVVSTASYEARKYGICSGMSSTEAFRRCPNAVFIHADIKRVVETSEIIKNIVADYSDKIEYVALDEAYIEMTDTRHLFHNGDIFKIMQEIKERIVKATGCSCTIGAGYSKYSAKLASEENKPDGLGKIMNKKELLDIITNRPVRILHGVGKQVEQHFAEKNIKTVKDIQMKTVEYMIENFGVNGIGLYYMAWGVDDRDVLSSYEEIGIGNSITLPQNISGLEQVKKAIAEPLKTACYRLKRKKRYAKNIQIKIRYGDFKTVTRAKQLNFPVNTLYECYKEVCFLLENRIESYSNIRLVGVRFSSLTDEKTVQFSLFEDSKNWEKVNKIDDISYKLRELHGYKIVRDTIAIDKKESSEVKNDSRGFDTIGDYRTVTAIKKLYR